MRTSLETAVGDVLYILDTCFAASAAIYDGPEVLAAVSWGDVAAANLQTSFTRMLIDELKALDGAPCPVARIYSSIHRNAITNNLERGPVHIPKKGKESIVLTKMHGPKQRKPESYITRKRRIDAFDPSENRVLIAVNLQDNIHMPDMEEWKNWLTTNIPSHILSSDITIEAVFHGSSSVLLVTLPVEVWTMLPADEEAYNFITFVQSNNILPQLAPAVSTPLAFRPAIPGRENQPPAHKRGQSYGSSSRSEERSDWDS
jgi:ribosomal protein S10